MIPDPEWRIGEPAPCLLNEGKPDVCGKTTPAQVRRIGGWLNRCPEHYGRVIVDGVVMRRER